MDHRRAEHILEEIDKTSLSSLRQGVLTAAIRYAHLRATWLLADPQQRAEMDAARTAAHNAFIDSVNILSRSQAKSGEDNTWRAALTDDRKTIGDFACHVHTFLSLRAR